MKLHVCLFASEKFKPQQTRQLQAFMDLGVPAAQIRCGGPQDLGADFFRDVPYASEVNRFAHYSFKPYFIGKVLQELPDDAVLLYLDANDRPLAGIKGYIQTLMYAHPRWNLVAPSTNYPNSRYSSWYHRARHPLPIRCLSAFRYQPEAGGLIVRAGAESQGLMRVWYALTVLHSCALQKHEDSRSRHDQETLFQLAQINNSVHFESWWRYRLLRQGLRRYVDWEFYRHAD